MQYDGLIDKFKKITLAAFGNKLVGIYLHGSLAMGCFNPNKSDIDIIVVIDDFLTDCQKLDFMRGIIDLNSYAPPKGLEISVVKKEYCNPFVYPTPYELHFSPAHLEKYNASPKNYIKKMKGTDKDLAAHFTVINNYGKVLYGEEIGKVFAEVPKADYIDSIYFDIENAVSDIMDNPVYVTLNLCRVLCFLTEGRCASKAEGGRWALRKLDFGTDIVNDALECYLSDKSMKVDYDKAKNFADRMLKAVQALK